MSSGRSPIVQPVYVRLRDRRLLLQDRLGLFAELALELGQVAAHVELPAVLVDHAEVHVQVRRRRIRAERVERHVQVECSRT